MTDAAQSDFSVSPAPQDDTGADAVRDIDEKRPVNQKERRSLYASRVKVHPQRIKGTFRRIKWAVMAAVLAIYYLTPWVRWDRGEALPDQAVLLDFPARRFYFFFIEIWPQEVYFITGLLVLASLTLFLMTSIAGRVWCGYMCPQTIWTDLFVHIERWIEGDRNKRVRLDKAPWTTSKISKKLIKHALWIIVSLATGGAWVFYFRDAPTLAAELISGQAPAIAYLFVGMFAFATYLLGGIAREQVCTYMCPWPRIQGAMLDEHSLIVSYRADRGEPRGPHKKGQPWDGRGDCVSCRQCVAVCPMGIDIRDGAQLECIHCALCIDACNVVMDKVGRPRGLIGYDTVADAERRVQGLASVHRFIRPRTLTYAGLIGVVSAIMLAAYLTRTTIDIAIERDRNPLYVTLSDGSIRNAYSVKILNKMHDAKQFDIALDCLPGSSISGADSGEEVAINVGSDTTRSRRVFVTLPRSMAVGGSLKGGSAALCFVVTDRADGRTFIQKTVFRGPET